MPRIARLDAWPVDVPMTKPFGIAGGAQEVARNVFVRVALDDGAVGYGEAAPFPAFNGETQGAVLAALSRARDAFAARSDPGLQGAALCAFETAVADAEARRVGMRIFGAPAGELRTDVTIPIGPVAECAADAAAWVARGFTRLKVKIGGAGLADALARTLAVHDAAPATELMLDGNAGLTPGDAVELLRALETRGVRPVLFEQPCAKDDVDGLLAVAAASDVPVALDESASSLADLPRFTGHPRFDAARLVVNLKPMKAGFAEALRIAQHAHRDAGMRLMIGGMVETRLAMTASACFVLAHQGRLRFDFVDLDTPLFLAEDPVVGGYAQDGERLDLSPVTAGHGVAPRVEP